MKARNAALCIAESEDLATPVRFTADFGYLRLRREDYTHEDMTRWAETVAEHRSRLKNIYIYLKHEESAMGPKLAKKLIARLESR